MYKVIEVANMLGVSKVTIYKKIEALRKEMKPYIHKKKNITFLDEEAVQIIKKNLSVGNEISLNEEYGMMKIEKEKMANEVIQLNDKRIESLELIASVLQKEIKFKTNHLETKNKQIKMLKQVYEINKQREEHIENYSIILNNLEDLGDI